MDLDFADIVNFPPSQTQGIIVLRIARQDKTTVLSTFCNIIQVLDIEPLEHKLWIVEESRYRVRE